MIKNVEKKLGKNTRKYQVLALQLDIKHAPFTFLAFLVKLTNFSNNPLDAGLT